MKNIGAVWVGAVLSALLLVLLAAAQSSGAMFLKLETQWIAVAVLPLLISLFVGGIIKKFKGFGLEIEATLKKPVASIELTASDAVADIAGDEKQSMFFLEGLSSEKKRSLRYLLFVSGRQNYYNSYAVSEYLNELNNVDFLDVRSKSGDFICFIPIDEFVTNRGEPNRRINSENVEKLIAALENNDVPNAFSSSAITLRVTSNQRLADVLKTMKAEKAEFAAVVSPTGSYLGAVYARDIERQIAESVLAATPS